MRRKHAISRFVARRSYDLRCNWKVYVDNYLDGGYHVSVLHKALAGSSISTRTSPRCSSVCRFQSCRSPEDAPDQSGGDFAEADR